ncbi:eukaryotic aspartyl protease family protein [Striga asiatica]|uniref:Eukaryotic aspartyl protease family protein n=1 Tax=Striga asiatica TaxID=4170 RepID=A0A5A7RKS8_STRAF|nr:eukaryotic aspartyl protease family protein [Striga asiatica]
MMMNPLSKYSSAALVVLIALLLIPLVPLSSSSTSFTMELIDPANPKHPSYHPSQLHNTLPPINTPVQTVGWQYYVSFSVGSQAVQLLAAMDLTTDFTWVQCNPCNPCAPLPNGDHDFEHRNSKTYRTVPCGGRHHNPCLSPSPGHASCSSLTCKYSVSYANGWSGGILSTDMFKLDNKMTPRLIHFGCGNANTGLSGVVGLGEGSASIVGQLQMRTFSYSLVPNSATLTFGGPTEWGRGTVTLPTVPMPKNGAYYLNLTGVSFGNTLLQASPALMLVNPQTIVTRLPSAIYLPLKRKVYTLLHKRLTQTRDPTSVFELCYLATPQEEKKYLPATITLHFQGGDVSLPRDNMFARLQGNNNNNNNVMCLAALQAQQNADAVYGSFAQTNFRPIPENAIRRPEIRRREVVFSGDANQKSFQPHVISASIFTVPIPDNGEQLPPSERHHGRIPSQPFNCSNRRLRRYPPSSSST